MYYVLRRRTDGRVIPSHGRGATFAEPVDPKRRPPRLFKSVGAARSALDWWLMGKTYNRLRYSEDGDVDLKTTPAPERRGEDWEVVPVALAGLEPVPVVLHCPRCALQHIDEVDEASNPDWENPPHTSHKCLGCGLVWRPADVRTEGVEAPRTRGSSDGPRSSWRRV